MKIKGKILYYLAIIFTQFSLFTGCIANSGEAIKAEKPNILFIAVDDLKPWVSAYGDIHAKTPGMDKLASEGLVFQNTYCQQAICAASRASIMTGMRPDRTRIWDLVTVPRQVNPNIVTIPQYFKSQGYETAGMGKIYHQGSAGPGHDAPSWSIPYRNAKAKSWVLPFTPDPKTGRGPSVECADVPDNTYHDGRLTEMAIELLDSLSGNEKPFFLAVGFLKPHLPFIAPKKYWDMYDRNEFELAKFQEKALNSPDVAYHQSGELKNYSDIPPFDNYLEDEMKHLSAEKQRELIHGYYAAMSYTDAQILQLLNELDRLGIRKNTIVVLWGDHGWHLGDHGLWCKHTNFEQATHTLLMLSAPGIKGGFKPVTISEFTDVFPTLCDLAAVPVPDWLDGISLVPAMKNPGSELEEFAFSQYPRGKDIMGYSIRTKRFRYTVWCGNNYRTSIPFDEKYVIAREMYDYENDYLETENVADKAEYAEFRKQMEQFFKKAMEKEYQSYLNYSKLADYKEPVDVSKKDSE